MAEFRALLQTAMSSGLANDRTQAENQLQQLCLNDTSNFFTNLVKELILETNTVGIRQFAGTLIKNSIRYRTANNDFLWNLVEENLRESIKSTLLGTMICKVPAIKMSCANAISTIFTVEIIKGRWTNLITDLTASTQVNISVDIRKAAILTLGQICDKLKEFKLGGLLDEKTKENILMAILIGLSQEELDVEIRENSIVALGDCVEFMVDILNREEVRDYATGLVINAIQHSNESVRQTALQRTSDYVKAIYVHFSKYSAAMLQATADSIKSSDEELCLPAIEIWTTIASEFQERQTANAQHNRVDNQQVQNPNHILLVHEALVQLLLQKLLVNDTEEEEAESSLQDASQKALCAIVESVGDQVVNTFTVFISNTLTSSIWQYRQAACLAFGALMEGLSENVIINLINPVLPSFVQTLRDQKRQVKESGAKLLAKIAEFHPQTVLLRPNFGADLNVILLSLKEIPAISRQICWFFCLLAENLDKFPQNQLSGSLDPLVSALIENATRGDFTALDLNVINVSFMSALNIIHYSRDPSIGLKYMKIFVTQFPNSYSIPADRRSAIQSGMLSALHACMLTLDNQFDAQMSEVVFQLVIDYFQFLKDVDSDGMYIISALSTCIEKHFVGYLDKVWPFIEHTLQNKQDDIELFKVCVGTVADIARACDVQFIPKIDVLSRFFAALEAPQINRDVKLNIFSCVGDIFLATKEQSQNYLHRLISIFDKSFNATIELSQDTSSDSQEYADQLKEKLIESYICVLHGINDKQQNPEFFNHCPKLVEFISLTCQKSLHPTVDYVRSCLTLMIDLGNFYKSLAGPHIKTVFTNELINTLQKYDQSDEGKEVISYAVKILQEL